MSVSPYLNHFIQPDTIIPDPSNPQALNRYSYVYNSPLNYVDPSGHDPWWLPQDSQDDYWNSSWLVQSNNGGSDVPKISGRSADIELNSGSGAGVTHIPSINDILPSPETMCGYVIEDYTCSADYSTLVDPYYPYSIPRMMQYYPIPLFYPERVDWGSLSIDLIGLTADFVPIAQPWATRIEIVDAINTGLNISKNTIQLDNLTHGRSSSVDWFGYLLDIASTAPEYGAPASAVGLFYNFGKGLSIYFPSPLHGPPTPRFSN